MANKMLIDATHPEETRVVVVRGNRVEEFDYESATRKQLRGNIYLAKVTRVEPSLQAAFIEYGGNRHGFLAFSEIHPDYYQIPVADRLALIEEEERAARLAEDEVEVKERRRDRNRARRSAPDQSVSEAVEEAEILPEAPAAGEGAPASDGVAPVAADAAAEEDARAPHISEPHAPTSIADLLTAAEAEQAEVDHAAAPALPETDAEPAEAQESARAAEAPQAEVADVAVAEAEMAASDLVEAQGAEAKASDDAAVASSDEEDDEEDGDDGDLDQIDEEEEIEHLGAEEDAMEEVPERAPQRRARSYKIQEVIRRRQVMLVQVVKEERGNKGAALTTYLSLAGRYSVLMPNTARGGGISRKITNTVDRKRLKEVVQDLEVPEGMGVILRTAGANRNKTEIKRDFEYLLRLWETVRELTLGSAAPSLVYEEGSLIKRAIRDLYNKDIDEVHVAGEEGYREAKDFMRMLMPSHAKSVLPYREPQPIFARYGVEQQLDAMFSPVVQLKSGGYIVINPTEALVSIDVNSGRATREHHIEDTALKTNLEASEEIARQLRLRDLAGLIVIDFIDMEEKRNNRAVERKIKDCLKNDRARIQIGRISHFGLLEMSRQRIRTGVLESSIEVCPHCGGTGHVRSAASVSLQLLRALEEQLLRSVTHNLVARTRGEVALYVLNQKRAHIRELEERFHVTLIVEADETVTGHQPFVIEKGDLAAPAPAVVRPSSVVQPDSILLDEDFSEEEEDEVADETAEGAEAAEADADGEGDAGSERSDEGGRRRRRRRRRRRGEREEGREASADGDDEEDSASATEEGDGEDAEAEDDERSEEERSADGERGDDENGDRRRRRRGRRGGRRNRREREGEDGQSAEAEAGEGDEDTGSEEAFAASETELSADIPVTLAEQASPVESVPLEAVRAEAPAPAAPEVSSAPAPAAEPVAAEPPVEAVEPAKPARRRSTVREKAPSVQAPEVPASPDTAAPAAEVSPVAEAAVAVETPQVETQQAEEVPPAAPQPAPASDEPPAEVPAEPAGKPRSGWWQRKLFGG